MEENKYAIQEVKIDFRIVDCGWIHYTIEVNNQEWDGQFSVVYDPIFDLKYWLEALARGVYQAAFIVDEEGWNIKFELEGYYYRNDTKIDQQITYEHNLFTLYNPEFEDKIYIKQYVNRKQLVSAFYNGLIEFSKSEKFSSEDWEIIELKDIICKKYNINEEELINILLPKTGKELADYLFEESPAYLNYATNMNDGTNQDRLGSEDNSSNTGNAMERNEWIIPDDYDNWNDNLKRKFINKCLKEQRPSYEGTKIKDFHSEIIENYLNPKETEEDEFINSLELRMVDIY